MTSLNDSFESVNVFTNVDAQDFVFRCSRDGASVLVETLQTRQTNAVGRIRRVLAACEVVAVANGNIDPDAGRSRLVEQWLFDSGYPRVGDCDDGDRCGQTVSLTRSAEVRGESKGTRPTTAEWKRTRNAMLRGTGNVQNFV